MPCFNRYNWPLFAVACLTAAFSCRLRAETVDIPTSYPSPSGSYVKLVTTGDSGPANTTLNSNGGNTILVTPSNPDGKVGIGVTNPAKKLDVGGDFSATGILTTGTDVKIGTSSVITRIICGPGLSCSRVGNILKISRVNLGSCQCLCTPTGYSSRHGLFCLLNCDPHSLDRLLTVTGPLGEVGGVGAQTQVSDNTGCTIPCVCNHGCLFK